VGQYRGKDRDAGLPAQAKAVEVHHHPAVLGEFLRQYFAHLYRGAYGEQPPWVDDHHLVMTVHSDVEGAIHRSTSPTLLRSVLVGVHKVYTRSASTPPHS
jgi:hypothetical protein